MSSVRKTPLLQVQILLVNLSLLLVLLLAARRGYSRGLLIELGLVGALVLAVGAAVLGYKPIGPMLANMYHLPLAISLILAYVLIFLGVQTMGVVAVVVGAARLSHRTLSSSFRLGGSMVAIVHASLLIAIFFGLVQALPMSKASAELLASGPIAGTYSWLGGKMQQFHILTPRDELGQALQLLTANPESTTVIPLNFTTDAGVVDVGAESQMLQMVNRERTSRGLVALSRNPAAQVVARNYSRDMLARGYFSHVNPEHQDPFARMRAGGVSFVIAGENLALAPTLARAHVGLMNSPGHRANILSPDYRTVGIGIIDAGPYGLMVTQDFTD